MSRRVVVTGMGCISPVGNNVKETWDSILAGKSGVAMITHFDASKHKTRFAAEVKGFDPAPAFPSPKEVRRTDRYSQFGVYAAWQAIRDSGLDLRFELG